MDFIQTYFNCYQVNLSVHWFRQEVCGCACNDLLNIVINRVKQHAAAYRKFFEIIKSNDRCVKVNGRVAFQHAVRTVNDLGKFVAYVVDFLCMSKLFGESR